MRSGAAGHRFGVRHPRAHAEIAGLLAPCSFARQTGVLNDRLRVRCPRAATTSSADEVAHAHGSRVLLERPWCAVGRRGC